MTKDTTSKIIKKIKELEKEEGKLPLLLEFYQQLLQIQSVARKRTGTLIPTISNASIKTRMSKGQPLVNFDEFALDWPLLRETFVNIITVFARYPQLFGDIPDSLKKQGAGRLLTKKAVKAWFSGKQLPPSLLEGVNENLMQTIIQATLQPFLASHALALIDSVEQENWRRGYCPICGGSPDLAYLEKEVGARWLLCSRCDSEWVFQRLECPYCQTREQSSFSYFSDEEDFYRLYVCEQCQCYLKVIDLRKAESEVLLPLERLYTMDLDLQARKRGYHPHQKTAADQKTKRN